MDAERGTSDAADADFGPVDIAEAGDARAVHVGGRAGEDEALGLAGGVEIIDVGGAETELDRTRGIFVGSGVEGEFRIARLELAPEGRLEGEREAQRVAIEGDGGIH